MAETDTLPPEEDGIHDKEDRRGMATSSLVSGNCIISGSHIDKSLLFTGVHTHSYSELNHVVALPQVEIARHAKLTKCVIDRGVKIPERLVVGEDPEEDARRFYRTEGGVVLITKPMIEALEA